MHCIRAFHRVKHMRQYYEAYDDRYRQVHEGGLQWFADSPSPIVAQVLEKFHIRPDASLLEVGCGEGRDAAFLLQRGWNVLGADISPEAISYCREKNPSFRDCFRVLNCITDRLGEKFDFIYAVAVVHMLVRDKDRDGFYRFLRNQLKDGGIALVCSMGNGELERSSDIEKAFDLRERTHEETGKTLRIAGTSYRSVSFQTFREELARNGLEIQEEGLTIVAPDYGTMMYAVLKRK